MLSTVLLWIGALERITNRLKGNFIFYLSDKILAPLYVVWLLQNGLALHLFRKV